MNNKISKQEFLELDKVLEDISSFTGQKITLNNLVNEWENFVNKCELGYRECFEEYINDISIREILFEITEKTGETLSNKILELINPIDKKFLSVTNSIEKSLITLSTPKKKIHDFLYLRIPKNLTGDLKEDISEMAFK